MEGPDGPEEFSKDVVVLSMAPDVMRTLYRHRQHGFLVDPGGSWFNSNMRQVLRDLDKVVWFRKNFEPIGEMTVQGYADNLFKIIQRIKQDVGAHVLVYNVLTVEPGSNTYNYQFVRDPHSKRRREFYLALVELSRALDFSIVDIDRVMKRKGIVEAQIDFAHFPESTYQDIGEEVLRVLRDLGVFEGK